MPPAAHLVDESVGPGQSMDPLLDIGTEVEELVEEQLRGGIATGTARTYQRGWEKWRLWARRHGWASPYMMGETRKERAEDEVRLLSFAGYLTWLGASPATVRQALFAIQGAHKRAGAGTPLSHAPRVWLLLKSLEKARPPAPRKLGVTVEMLEWLKRHLQPRWPKGDAARRKWRRGSMAWCFSARWSSAGSSCAASGST